MSEKLPLRPESKTTPDSGVHLRQNPFVEPLDWGNFDLKELNGEKKKMPKTSSSMRDAEQPTSIKKSAPSIDELENSLRKHDNSQRAQEDALVRDHAAGEKKLQDLDRQLKALPSDSERDLALLNEKMSRLDAVELQLRNREGDDIEEMLKEIAGTREALVSEMSSMAESRTSKEATLLKDVEQLKESLAQRAGDPDFVGVQKRIESEEKMKRAAELKRLLNSLKELEKMNESVLKPLVSRMSSDLGGFSFFKSLNPGYAKIGFDPSGVNTDFQKFITVLNRVAPRGYVASLQAEHDNAWKYAFGDKKFIRKQLESIYQRMGDWIISKRISVEADLKRS